MIKWYTIHTFDEDYILYLNVDRYDIDIIKIIDAAGVDIYEDGIWQRLPAVVRGVAQCLEDEENGWL